MKETIKNLKRVYSYAKDGKKSLILEIIGSIIGIIISLILPILAAKQIVYLTDNIWTQLIYMSIVIMLLGFIQELKTVLIRKNTQKLTIVITENIQKRLGKEILKVSQSDLDSNSSGTFVQRMTSDTDELANMFTTGVGRIVGIVSSIGTFISILIINRECFIFYLICSAILTCLHLRKSKKYRIKDNLKRKQSEVVSSLTGELVRGARDIKMLNARSSFMDNLNLNIKEKNKRYLEMRNVDINYNYLIGSLSSLFEFCLIILLIYLIKNDILSAAMAIALYSYRTTVMSNFMQKVSLLLEEANSFNLSFERVFSILDSNNFRKEKFGEKHLDKVSGEFEFKNVKFSYDENLILNDLSFKIKPNEMIGFVGKSGAGKTTIFNLLCKMYDIDEGEILIDGININELDEDSIRGNITIISQNPYIFNMSIKDNLRLVKDNVTEEEIVNACKMASLDDYISSLPNGYDTIVGEGGVTLSGGQRQRLAIARAFIQETKIILFDEATSALDNETQYQIQMAINNMRKDYTILIIAHRLSTIINSDRILFIDEGKIVDSGTHEELLKKNKEYKKLYAKELKK